MSAARGLSWTLLVAGLASLVYAALQGELDVYLLVVIPVVAGTGGWSALGLLGTIAGLAGLAWTGARRQLPPGSGSTAARGGSGGFEASRQASKAPGERERETKSGGVILLGPIPIAWGSDASILGWMVAAGLLLTLAAIALVFFVQP